MVDAFLKAEKGRIFSPSARWASASEQPRESEKPILSPFSRHIGNRTPSRIQETRPTLQWSDVRTLPTIAQKTTCRGVLLRLF